MWSISYFGVIQWEKPFAALPFKKDVFLSNPTGNAKIILMTLIQNLQKYT